MSETLQTIFGAYMWIQIFGFSWFLGIGYLIYALNETSGRDKMSKNTPKKWKWKFWFENNWRRYLVTILSTYVLFRFYIDFNEHPFGNFDALMMGLIGDGIGATAKKRLNMIKADREKIIAKMSNMIKYNELQYL